MSSKNRGVKFHSKPCLMHDDSTILTENLGFDQKFGILTVNLGFG